MYGRFARTPRHRPRRGISSMSRPVRGGRVGASEAIAPGSPRWPDGRCRSAAIGTAARCPCLPPDDCPGVGLLQRARADQEFGFGRARVPRPTDSRPKNSRWPRCRCRFGDHGVLPSLRVSRLLPVSVRNLRSTVRGDAASFTGGELARIGIFDTRCRSRPQLETAARRSPRALSRTACPQRPHR
jgi:hypothetical protein